MNEEKRYCDYYSMSPQELQNYKNSKFTRIFLYIIVMIFNSLFIARWTGYIFITAFLIWSYYNDSKCEEQWIKDGGITREQLRS